MLIVFQPALLDAFVRTAVSCKQSPRLELVGSCAPLLRQLSHEELSGILLPAMQRALLRSPEVILPSVGRVLAALSLDLSQYTQPADAASIARSLASKYFNNINNKSIMAAFVEIFERYSM